MVRCLMVAVIFFGIAGPLVAQPPGAPASNNPRPSSPPAGSSGAQTARDRQIQAGAERIAREFTKPDKEPVQPPKPPERSDDPGTGKAHVTRVSKEFSKEFLESLVARSQRIKTLSCESELRIMTPDGRLESRKLWYGMMRDTTGVVRHRLAISDATGMKDVILIHEVPGDQPVGWHLGPEGKPESVRGDPLAMPVIPGSAFRVVDLLPFEPQRIDLTIDGESQRDGQPVVVAHGTMKVGRADSVQLMLHRHNRQLLRMTGHDAKPEPKWLLAASDLKERDTVAAFETLTMLDQASEATMLMRCGTRKVNQKVEPSAFEPVSFAP